VWLSEPVKANEPSEAFLFAGWPRRSAWIHNQGTQQADFTFHADRQGNGRWEPLRTVSVAAGAAVPVEFASAEAGEWVRVTASQPTIATVHFFYAGRDNRTSVPDAIFTGLTKAADSQAVGGLLYGLGDDRRVLGVSAVDWKATTPSPVGYYELDANMQLRPRNDPKMRQHINEKFAIPKDVITIDESSVLVVDERGRRWRLPLGDPAYKPLVQAAATRIAREVATERDLLNCMGTFYELPAENADGFAKIRPVASHNFRVHDYASYRGLLVMTGVDPRAGKNNPHVIVSDDGRAAVWAGVIDDLWKLGKPTGRGGPWKDTNVKANQPSDPYLIGFYHKRTLALSHQSKEPVTFRIEAEPVGHGPWMSYREVTVDPGQTWSYTFPDGFQARWIRLVASKSTTATAWLTYE
jgi:hypothetical protein